MKHKAVTVVGLLLGLMAAQVFVTYLRDTRQPQLQYARIVRTNTPENFTNVRIYKSQRIHRVSDQSVMDRMINL